MSAAPYPLPSCEHENVRGYCQLCRDQAFLLAIAALRHNDPHELAILLEVMHSDLRPYFEKTISKLKEKELWRI